MTHAGFAFKGGVLIHVEIVYDFSTIDFATHGKINVHHSYNESSGTSFSSSDSSKSLDSLFLKWVQNMDC